MSNSDATSGPTGISVKPLRRILTTHSTNDTSGSHVILHDELIPLRPVLDAQAHINPFHAHLLPSSNPLHISAEELSRDTQNLAMSGVVTKGGVNGQVTQLNPGFKVGMHRTNSIDYNIIVEGSVWLITPGRGDGSGSASATGSGSGSGSGSGPGREGRGEGDGQEEEETRTLVKAGEIVVQRGTLHAWEAGDQGVRWITIVVGVDKGVEIGGKELEEVAF